MKKLLSSLILISSFQLFAQPNSAVMNSRWINAYYEIYQSGTWNFPQLVRTTNYCTSTDDTLINGENYIKLYTCGTSAMSYRGALRVDQDRWYFYSVDSTQEMLLYDFGLEVGDTLHESFYSETSPSNLWSPNIVVQVDTFDVLGVPRKHIYFNYSSGGGAWIEGIGCQQGLLWDPYSNISNFAITLECYSHNDTARLTSSNYNGNLNEACLLNFALDEQDFFPARLYPNPGHNNVTLDISDYTGPMELKIFSTSGQELFAQVITQANTTIQHDLPEGIYMVVGFYRGRSFVRKMVVTE